MAEATPIQNNPSIFDKSLDTANLASKMVNQFVVSPILGMGLAGFVFDGEDETKIELQSEVTEHYTENNTAISDNIALKPVIITLRGYVGELVYRGAKPKSQIQKLTEKISTINAFIPVLTASASQAKSILQKDFANTQNYYSQALASGVDLYQTFHTLNPPKTAQARAFNFFRSMWAAKQLVSLETPYSFFRNMAILGITAIQDKESKYVTDFSITLKQVNFAETKLVKYDPTKFQQRSAAEISEPNNKGKVNSPNLNSTKKQDVNSSFIKKLIGG